MSLIRHVAGGLRALLFKSAIDRELDDEVRQYLEAAAAEHQRAGMSREQAERAARVEFGGVENTKEVVRSGGWEALLESWIRDLQYAARSVRTSPGFAIAAIAILGTGIALTTSVMTVTSTVLRQQWPVSDPSRVFTLLAARGGPGFSPAEARYFGENAKMVQGVVVVRCLSGLNAECQLKTDGGPVTADLVSGNFFSTLGVGMQAGRGFVDDDDRPDAPRAVAIVSDAMWRNRFGAFPGIIGREMRLDDVTFTIVGVAARDFTGTRMEKRDVWLPLSSMLLLRPGRQHVRNQLTDPSSEHSEASVAARLAPTATVASARAELVTLSQRYHAEHRLEDRGVRLIPTTFFPNPAKLRTARGLFALMIAAVTLVLLLACANVGNLLLARATSRRREIAVRLALGASRRRVVRQLLTEGLLLAAAGGVIGVFISFELPNWLMTQINGPLSWHFEPDAAVLLTAVGVVVTTCLACALAPALHATREDVSSVLRSADDWAARSRSRWSLRGSLLAIQIAISLLLLVNAGVLVRGIQHGRDRDPGFSARGVTLLSFDLPASYDPARTWAFSRQLMDDSRSMDGARIAFASDAPLDQGRMTRYRLPNDAAAREYDAWVVGMSRGFLDVLGMPIVAGRDIQPSDGEDAVLVNQAMARSLWPGESALGKVIIDDGERRVVGVVRDASVYRLDRVEDVLFRPIDRTRVPVMLVRSPSPAITQLVTAAAERIDPRVHVRVDSIAGNVERQLGGLRTIAELAGVLGVIALALATVGVFSVFAYFVHRRTREIGIRTALGASSTRIIVLVLRDTGRAIGVGIAIGFLAAVGVARMLQSELFGASAFDLVVFVATAVLLALAGVVATYVPARRAARIDPMSALRAD